MRLYVETNFGLELARDQAEAPACRSLLSLCVAGHVELAIPAFALVEPWHSMEEVKRRRERLRREIRAELQQLARSAACRDRAGMFDEPLSILLQRAEEDDERLRQAQAALQESAEVIPLTATVLELAGHLSRANSLSAPDAVILASVAMHLETSVAAPSCFVARDSDFGSASVFAELSTRGCEKVLFRFADALAYVRGAS